MTLPDRHAIAQRLTDIAALIDDIHGVHLVHLDSAVRRVERIADHGATSTSNAAAERTNEEAA